MESNVSTRPANILVKFLTSTVTGLVLLWLVIVYIAAASMLLYLPEREIFAYTGVSREAFFRAIFHAPATAAGAYGHPIFLAMVAALCVNILLATLVRIRPCRLNAGAWISHLGVIVLAAGSVWHASTKVSGDCSARREPGGWSPIKHVYLSGQYSLYVSDAERSETRQVKIENIGLGEHEVEPLAPVVKFPDGLKLGVTDYLPAAVIEQQWKDDAPNPVPAVLVHVSDSLGERNVLLCEQYQRHRRSVGDGYVMVCRPGTTPAQLEELSHAATRPADGAMPYDVGVIVTGGQIAPSLVIIRSDYGREVLPLALGEEVQAELGRGTVGVELLRIFTHARRSNRALPAEANSPGASPAIRVELVEGDWRRTTELPLNDYAHLSTPHRVDLPRGRMVHLNFARRRVPLPATVWITDTQYLTYPGMTIPKDYVCQVLLEANGRQTPARVSLNNPLKVGAFQLSQNAWRPAGSAHPMQVVLGAATRPALGVIWTGCAMVVAGLLYAFYLKRIILRRRNTGTQ